MYTHVVPVYKLLKHGEEEKHAFCEKFLRVSEKLVPLEQIRVFF